MALKKFRVHYKRRCTVATYDHSQVVMAVSEKMALKKFWNHKDFNGNCNRKDMEYETDALGFEWFDVRVELISN